MGRMSEPQAPRKDARAREGWENPFAQALRSLVGEQGQPGASADALGELSRHSLRLGPLVKRRLLDGLQGVPAGLHLGWAQLPASRGVGFSLGLFTDRSHFLQIALADGKGRVFVGTDPTMDTHPLEPRMMLVKEGGESNASRPGTASEAASRGGVVARDMGGRMVWLASWRKEGKRYTLEQLRAPLPASMRLDLSYRDAIAIAFFAAYMLPQINGLLLGFGAGNIFRRLGREAPIGAIRRSVRDAMEARAHGMRASGLEDHFARLMGEAGALDDIPGLEAVHGAEPLRLFTSSYSGCYFFAWHAQIATGPALTCMKVEGNLNRFSAVSAWLERNARAGFTPTEDTVTAAQAAQIDMALLDNPALLALDSDTTPEVPFDPVRDDGTAAVWSLVEKARDTAWSISQGAGKDGDGNASGEWVYRQAMALLLRRLRLPYRFDAEFRANLAQGVVGLAVTAAGASLMPDSRYDAETHDWVTLDQDERARMGCDYNLRVGLMMAALAFGADTRVKRVSLRIDSIGLEEALAEQDSAISELVGQALSAFERMHSGDVATAGSKADPKDGDRHGDPSHGLRVQTGLGTDLTDKGESIDAAGGDEDFERRFEDMMRGLDIDESVFALDRPSDADATGDAEAGDSGNANVDGSIFSTATPQSPEADGEGDGDDPMQALRRNPTLRTLVTVTFERDELLSALKAQGLRDPEAVYRRFDATMRLDEHGGLAGTDPSFDLRDASFSPTGSQEEPELSDRRLDEAAAHVLGAQQAEDLSIQRADLLQRAVTDFHRLAADPTMASVAKAQEAMRIVTSIGDPELMELAPQATSALIDGGDTPDFAFALSDDLDRERVKARDLLFSGQAEQAFESAEATLERFDAMFASCVPAGVPRYFNSYAERVVYNRLFATPGENTVLIPDNLFYAHMELADVLCQLKGAKAGLPHLNAMVSYAPAYPLAHMKLAVQLARLEDWDSARAACLNALRVALDRDDAAFAYYRFAYAEWMQDRFDTAAAAYIMAEQIAPGQIPSLGHELEELVSRADSQCVPVPESVEAAAATLEGHGLPVWPRTEVADIVHQAARVAVDEGMFVPARTLSVAAARMDDGGDGIDVVQAQFLRSLNA